MTAGKLSGCAVLSVLLLGLAPAEPAVPQCTLAGHVKRFTDEIGIAGVRLVVSSGQVDSITETMTDADGKYSIVVARQPNTVLNLYFSRVGYLPSPARRVVQIDSDVVRVDVSLLPVQYQEATYDDSLADLLAQRALRTGLAADEIAQALDSYGISDDRRELLSSLISDRLGGDSPVERDRRAPAIDSAVRIVVLEFQDATEDQRLREGGSEAMTEAFTAALVESGRFSVVERARLNAVLTERWLTVAGDLDPSAAREVGDLLGAQYLVVGAVTEYGRTDDRSVGAVSKLFWRTFATAEARIIDLSTGEVVWSDKGRAEGSESAFSVYGLGGAGHEDPRMFEKVMVPLVHQLVHSIASADLARDPPSAVEPATSQAVDP